MERIVTIHQPEHMPWTGFFHKMMQADHYVILDSVQYEKDYFQNRNKVVDKNGKVDWISVPVQINDGKWKNPIVEIEIDLNRPWQKKYLGRIMGCYEGFPFFKEYFPIIEKIINGTPSTICQLNINIINFFREILSIDTPISFASELSSDVTQSQLLLNICKHNNATTYLSGPSGKGYLDEGIFNQSGIKVEYHKFTPPEYEMANPIVGLSTLDVIMRFGPDSSEIIKSSCILDV